jgi:hypothetical protein
MRRITLYRPVGQKEFDLVKESGFRRFPPRLFWQPIFYPVLNQSYAEQIARDWNTKDEFSGYVGYVLSFELPEEFVTRYPVQNVGGELHNELWVPAAELDAFNEQIAGEIKLVATFWGEKRTEK